MIVISLAALLLDTGSMTVVRLVRLVRVFRVSPRGVVVVVGGVVQGCELQQRICSCLKNTTWLGRDE